MADKIKKDLMKFMLKEEQKVILYNDDEYDFEIPVCILAAKFFSPVLTAAIEAELLNPANNDANISLQKTTNDKIIKVDSVTEDNSSSSATENVSNVSSSESWVGEYLNTSNSRLLITESVMNNLMENTVDRDKVLEKQKKYANCPRINITGFDKATVECFVRMLHVKEPFMELSWCDLIKMLKISHFYGVVKFVTILKENGKEMIHAENLVEAISLMDLYDINEWLEKCSFVIKDDGADDIKLDVWEQLMETHPKIMARVLNRYLEKRGLEMNKSNYKDGTSFPKLPSNELTFGWTIYLFFVLCLICLLLVGIR